MAKMIRSLFLISLVILQVMATSRAPTPYCMAHQDLKHVPLSLGEKIEHNVDQMFSGYNLDITLASKNTFAVLNKKLTEIDRHDGYFPDIISHYVEHDGNNWGKDSYILYHDNTSYIFAFAKIKDEYHVPEIDFTATINASIYKCFGAALLVDFGVGIVDCAKKQQDSPYFDNYFIYVDLAAKKISKEVKNAAYVRYTEVTKRKLMKYKDLQTGYEYIIRVHPADGVNREQRGNTYMEIFQARDPYDLQIMKVIDRTYVHTNSLSIIDAKVYLGDIFFLDYLHGLFRLDILHSTEVLITGRYIKDGFTKFAVYSDDLENEVLIALANNHAVYEIDWSNIRNPIMVTKYSLMEQSRVKQLIINDLFVVVQSAANATNQTHPLYEIDYTWIFSRGARTYTNAYSIIDHKNSKVELEFNRFSDRLLTADQTGIKLYQISAPILKMSLGEESKIGTTEDLVFLAKSTDPSSKDSNQCQLRIKVHFVRSDDMTLYEEDYDTTSNYSINYPGQLRVNLDNYVWGPNMTYSLVNKTAEHEIPEYWIDKVNLTKINIDFGIGDVIFFHTQVVPMFGKERIIYYAQDSRYITHVVECMHLSESAEAICHQEGQYAHTSALSSFTTAFFYNSSSWNYFYFFSFEGDPKTITVIDYRNHEFLMNITYQGHEQAVVTQLSSSNGFLYVLRGGVKTIDVYKIADCQAQLRCKPDFYIDHDTLKPFSVNYFAPLQVVTDGSHPEVLFIRCRGSIIILDIDNKQKILLLDEIISTITQNAFYRIAVNRRKLIIVSDPDIIDLYSLEHIYIKNQVRFLVRLPVYHYEIQPISDIEFSDFDDLIYVNAVDKTQNISTILIYRVNRPAATALYHVIPLRKIYSRPALEIEVSGFYVDFLNIKTPDGFYLYRVFQFPALMVKDIFLDFKFQIEFTNPKTKLDSELLQVHTVNFPSGFVPMPELNKTLNSLKLDHHENYTWDDRKWFKGSILSYNFSCPECGEGPDAKVHLRQHVDPIGNVHISSYDYTETLDGGVSVYDDLFRFRFNGTVRDVINLPDQKKLERCVKVATAFHSQLIITACQELGRGINVYISSQISFKPWTWGPYRSSAVQVREMQVAGDILMIADISMYPDFKFEKGAIYLYELGLDYNSADEMDELEVIDENDLVNAHGYNKDQVFIGNAHLVFTAVNNCFRLYITEVDGGLFVVDFTHDLGRRQINIITTNYIDVKKLLEKFDLHFPTDASLHAVNLVSYKYNPHFYTESVVVTAKNYHNIEILLVYDDNGNVLSSIVHRIYYRYGYYNSVNSVKTASGYMAISYVIPYIYDYMTTKSKQIVAVYDTRDYDDDHERGFSERYMLGAVRLNSTSEVTYAFNTTYDFRTNGTRIGLIVTNPYQAPSKNMYQFSISRNLTIEVKKDFKDQTITIIPWSDFEVRSFQMKLINHHDDDDDGDKEKEKVIIIIVIVLAVVITIAFTIYIFCLVRKRRTGRDEERRSLLTEGETIRNSIEPRAGDYVPPTTVQALGANQEEESSSSSEMSEEEQKEPIKKASAPAPVPKVQSTPTPQQITIPKEPVVEKPEPQPEPKVEEKKVEVPVPVVAEEPKKQAQPVPEVKPTEPAAQEKAEEPKPEDKKQPQA